MIGSCDDEHWLHPVTYLGVQMHPGVQASVMWPGGCLSVCLSREVTAQPPWEHYVPGVPPPSPELGGFVHRVLNHRSFFKYLYGL